MILELISAFLLFSCIGSFLNVLSWRVVHRKSFFKVRSYCPHCMKTINIYDLIPIISWFYLKGRCRFCNNKISFLYPLIEFSMGLIGLFLYYFLGRENVGAIISYGIFCSLLLCATRTDLEMMVIPQLFTLYVIPVGFFCSYFNYIHISFLESIIGAFVGYGSLWILGIMYHYIRKKEGIGEGDFELLAFIGSFLGPLGVYYSVMFGSCVSLIIIFLLSIFKKININQPFPFGPFLSFGALLYLFIFLIH